MRKVLAIRRVTAKRLDLKSTAGSQQHTTLRRAGSCDSGLNVASELRAPYIKFEETNFQFRPVFFEFKKFPSLHPENPRPGVSPFYAPDPSYVVAQAAVAEAAAAQNRGPIDQADYQDLAMRLCSKTNTWTSTVKCIVSSSTI